MTQLDPSRYKKLTQGSPDYGTSYGVYWDATASKLVLTMNDVVVAQIDATGITADLEVSGEARGDILRRGASAWERHASKTSGQVLAGDGSDIKSHPITQDVSVSSSGGNLVATVVNLTQTGQAAGDLLYRDAASTFTRLAKGTLGQFLQMNSGATAPEWDSIKTCWPFRIPAASGKDTDAKGGAIAGCNNAGDLTTTEASATYCKVYDLSATAYANLETASAGDFIQWQLLPNNTQDNDAVYFGASSPFWEIWLDMSATVSTYTGDALTWEFWNGSAWTAFVPNDYTDATAQDGKRSFGRDGAISWAPLTGWTMTAVDTLNKYWVRARVSTVASLGVLGITNSKRHYYVTPTDGFVVPHACTITGAAIRDEAATVHAANAIVFQIINFTSGANSGSLTFGLSKRNDVFTGLTLACAAGDVLGVIISTEDGTNEAGPFTLELGATLT